MNIIVNVDRNWAIGNKGALLFPIPADLQNFKRLTIHKTVIMGRATLESLPNGEPLKERQNIVLSKTLPRVNRTDYPHSGGFYVCPSLNHLELLLKSAEFSHVSREDIFVIGGARVYAELLPLCNTAFVTKVKAAAPYADAFFPNLDSMHDWHITDESDTLYHNGLPFRFVRYGRE